MAPKHPHAEWFLSAPVPHILTALGSAYAVHLRDTPPGPPAEACDQPMPPSLHRAVPSRVRSYLGGRHCAARGLAALAGVSPVSPPLTTGRGPFGAPQWPDGLTGSITHSSTLAIAVVTHTTTVHGIGIDCERIMSAEAADDIVARVLPEADAVARRGDDAARMPWPVFVTTVFSAKESIYKCLNPLNHLFFEFDAVALEWIDIAGGNMGFRVVSDLGAPVPVGSLLSARFCVDDEHVVTAVALSPRPAVPARPTS